jgi:hypothetical protein
MPFEEYLESLHRLSRAWEHDVWLEDRDWRIYYDNGYSVNEAWNIEQSIQMSEIYGENW